MHTGGPPELHIRPACAGDVEALVELWDLAGLTRWWNDPRADLRGFRENGNAEVLAGELDGRVVASVCVGHDGHRGWCYYLAVHPGKRHRGYGRQLVRAAELWLSERGIAKVNAMIRATNHEAFGFYQAMGYDFDAVGVLSHWLRDPGLPPDSGVRPDESGKIEVIVTYLEMTAPPAEAPPHPPAGQRVALMRAERPGCAFYRFLYDTIGESWLWWERRALDDRALARVIQDDRVEIYVLYVDGVPAGFAELDRRYEPEIELAYFGIMPDYIGRGFGSYLLASALHTAWSYAPAKLTLNTNTLDHPRALPLYQKLGFVPVRRETRTIDDPRITGLIPLR